MIYLALCHSSQCLNHRQLHVYARRLIQKVHDDLHHLGDGLFELSMLFAEQLDLLIQQAPVSRVFRYRDDGDEQARCGREIGGLAGLLL